MNKKQQQIKNRTWHYFWNQKFNEVFIFLLIIACIIFIPYLLGSITGDGYDDKCGQRILVAEECDIIETWFEGTVYVFGSFLILVTGGLFIFIGVIFVRDWIKSNWEKAEKRAKEDLK